MAKKVRRGFNRSNPKLVGDRYAIDEIAAAELDVFGRDFRKGDFTNTFFAINALKSLVARYIKLTPKADKWALEKMDGLSDEEMKAKDITSFEFEIWLRFMTIGSSGGVCAADLADMEYIIAWLEKKPLTHG